MENDAAAAALMDDPRVAASAEVPVDVDVDAVLRQLKQAKDRELRLRAEKARVRKELAALQTGELWTREVATQRELVAIQTRKQVLKERETTERERLKLLDEELRDKEVSVQRGQRRLVPDVLKQAASTILAPAASIASDPSVVTGPEQRSPVQLPVGSSQTLAASPTTNSRHADAASERPRAQNYRPRGNQDTDDAVTRLAFSLDLEKQQTRIHRLQQQLEQSTALHQSGRDAWDLPSAAVPTDRLPSTRQDRRTEVASLPMVHVDQDRPEDSARVTDQRVTEPAAAKTISRESPVEATPLHAPQLPRPTSGWSSQPPLIATQPLGDPRFVYQTTHPMIPLIPSNQPGVISSGPPAMLPSAYPIFSPPAVVPAMPPSVYAPWSYAPPPFGAFPSYSYAAPVVAQPPHAFAQPPASFLSHPSLPSARLPVEHDVARLQHHLDALRRREQEQDDDKEFTKVQELLTGLQHQVTQLTRAQSADIEEAVDDSSPRTTALAETTEPSLRALKRQHLEALLKVRNERDLLEEQDKLEEMQERIEKRRSDRQRDSMHEAYVTKQKQELMALRLQRALAKLDVRKASGDTLVPDQVASNEPYEPDEGVVLCWDYASGLLVSAEHVQLTFAVYDRKIPRSAIKALVSRECERDGPTNTRAIFAASRVVKPLPASTDVVVVVEVSCMNPPSQASANAKPTLRRLGWAAMELFQRRSSDAVATELSLVSGWMKLKLLSTPMPDPTKVVLRGSAAATDTADATSEVGFLHFRVAAGEWAERARNTVVDPDVHAGRYQLLPAGTRPGAEKPRAQYQPTDEHNPACPPADPALGRPALPSVMPPHASDAVADRGGGLQPTTISQQHSCVDKPPPSRDFLDIERLRLLSSSSTTTRPQSNLARPRSTLSAIPRNRVGGMAGAGAGLLPAVPETSTFDDASPSSPWIRVDDSLGRQRRLTRKLFQPGDAFDVYVDGARFLPDNVTVTKVTIAALHADRSKISPLTADSNSRVAISTSDACHPTFNLYLEYREKTFDPTLTLVLRVDTLDLRTKQPVILAYAVFPVFLDADSLAQPTRANGVQFALNEGTFQLPLYTTVASLSDTAVPFSAASAVAAVPKLPCATLLLRVKSATTSEDGLQLLSRQIVPPSEWAAHGLDTPAPPYHSGAYDSTASTPTPLEMKMYQLRELERQKRSMTVEQKLRLVGLLSTTTDTLFPAKPSTFMDLRYAFRYQPAIGFRVAVDGLHNVKLKAGSFCRVLYSVAPPGAFYQSIRLTSGVQFTTTTDWTSLPTSPEFRDGFTPFRDLPADPRLVVVIDVRVVAKNPKTNAYQSQPLAWSFVPVLLSDQTGAVAAGSFQIPLFTGEVKLAALDSPMGLTTLIEDIAAERKKVKLPFMDGASVFVRLEDPQVPAAVPLQPIIGASLSSMMPAKAIPRYHYDAAKVALAKKKTPLTKQLPAGISEKQLDAEINQAFATEMGLHH